MSRRQTSKSLSRAVGIRIRIRIHIRIRTHHQIRNVGIHRHANVPHQSRNVIGVYGEVDDFRDVRCIGFDDLNHDRNGNGNGDGDQGERC